MTNGYPLLKCGNRWFRSVLQIKRITDMLDLWDFMVGDEDGDDVEAGNGVWLLVMREPGEGSTGNLALLERGHCKLRWSVCEIASGLDLDKDNGIAISCDDVDLAGLAAVVLFQDGEPLSPEICLGNTLPPLANTPISGLLLTPHTSLLTNSFTPRKLFR